MELAAAIRVLLAPAKKLIHDVLVKPVLKVSHFVVDFWSRYFLDYPIGHFLMRTVFSPLMSYSVARVFDARAIFGLFKNIPGAMRVVIAGFSTIFSAEIISEPVRQIISNFSVVYTGVMYGSKFRSDMFTFFYFCTWQNGRYEGENLGSGDEESKYNAYYPTALGEGIQDLDTGVKDKFNAMKATLYNTIPTHDFLLNSRNGGNTEVDTELIANVVNNWREKLHKMDKIKLYADDESQSTANSVNPEEEWEKEKTNMEIAMSCVFFSLLTYQTDEQFKEAQSVGMMKDLEIFYVETGSSGTQMVAFVNHEKKFAVFGYRGTQFQILRQFLTSLDFRTEYFQSLHNGPGLIGEERARIRSVYYSEVRKSYEMLKFKTLLDGEEVSARQLLEHLKLNLDYKIYLTGHSLGGGLSTVLAAHLMTISNGEHELFDALVTFGATPVGDANFVKWFESRVPTSWRFMFGDEFAPMVPPLPYFNPVEDTELKHVGDFHHFELPSLPVAENAEEADQLLQSLADSTGMMDIFVHHNPMLTLRALKNYHNPKHKGKPGRLLLDIKNKKAAQPMKSFEMKETEESD